MWNWPAAATLIAASLPAPPPPSVGLSMESQVLAELNRARADPAAYAVSLDQYRHWYRGTVIAVPGAPVAYQTQEGAPAADEALAFLAARRGGEAELAPASVLAAAAVDHRDAQARDGTVGHVGTDGAGPGERSLRRGGGAFVGEVIAYGSDAAADMVRQLIVDDGVPDRSHRELLFDPSLRYAGVSCGSHPVYRTVCVVTLARTPDGRSRFADGDPDGRRRLAALDRRSRRG